MIDYTDIVWSFSIISLILYSLQVLGKIMFMGLGCKSPQSSSSSPSSSSMLWPSFRSRVFVPKGITLAFKDQTMDNISCYCRKIQVHGYINSAESVSVREGCSEDKFCCTMKNDSTTDDQEMINGNMCLKSENNLGCDHEKVNKLSCKLRKKKPARLVIPETCVGLGFNEMCGEECKKEFEVEGRDFCLASRRGRREVIEDGYGIITDIMGDSKQAFFGVFDGHGGRAAMEYVVENLGKNIISALGEVVKRGEADHQLEKAIKEGYLTTDKDFLCKDVSSGACAATVLLKNGELYAANVGDCRVVLSRNGVAYALTSDHHVDREDERFRIENSGGFLNCRHGVWRVQGSLAVSRAIGDSHLKEWVISEPEIEKLRLTSECEFLVIASDGLWEKVTNQEAVDLILKEKGSIESCKKLINLSSSRGSIDDITVMVVDLQNFKL